MWKNIISHRRRHSCLEITHDRLTWIINAHAPPMTYRQLTENTFMTLNNPMEKIQKLIEWIEGIPDKNNDLMKWLITVILYEARKIQAESVPLPTKAEMLKASITMDFWNTNSATVEPVWTPTKNEEIEVSDDGKKWDKRKFIKMDGGQFPFQCHALSNEAHRTEWFKKSRPLTVEKEEIKPIEPPPKYKATRHCGMIFESKDEQIQALTKSLREVIDVVNKLNNK